MKSAVAMALCATLSGCSSEAEKPLARSVPGVPTQPDSADFMVETAGTTIAPGEDAQYCEVAVLPTKPGEPLYVTGIDGKMTPFSHHLNVMAIEPGSQADRATTPGQRERCTVNGEVPFGGGLREIFMAQSPEVSLALPEGVGHRLDGGQKILFDYHYFNSSTGEISAKAKLTFHVAEAGEVKREVRRFGMYNNGIRIPAQTRTSFIAECLMAEDIEVLSLVRHTHRLGTDFTVWRAGGPSDAEQVFVSHHWEDDIDYAPAAPFTVKRGEGFRFECTFDNTTDQQRTFGELFSDEMCVLYGYFVSKDLVRPLPEDCIIGASTPGQVAQGVPCGLCP